MKPTPELARRLTKFLANAEIAFGCAAFVAFTVASRVVFTIAEMAANQNRFHKALFLLLAFATLA